MGVIPTLVKLLGIHCQNAALTEMCLVAFGNLAELGKSWLTALQMCSLYFARSFLDLSHHLTVKNAFLSMKNVQKVVHFCRKKASLCAHKKQRTVLATLT